MAQCASGFLAGAEMAAQKNHHAGGKQRRDVHAERIGRRLINKEKFQ